MYLLPVILLREPAYHGTKLSLMLLCIGADRSGQSVDPDRTAPVTLSESFAHITIFIFSNNNSIFWSYQIFFLFLR